jgi:adenosylcobinamide-phosphate synthase
MDTAGLLTLALLLDALLGEPGWLWSRLPHPAVLMGRGIGWLESRLNRGTGAQRLAAGNVTLLAIVAVAGAVGWLIQQLGPVAIIPAAAILLAQRSLVDHVRAVADGLRMSLAEGRRAVGRIVSRDTAAMDGPAVTRAAIESAAENLSDGVIAPAFWFLVAGLPGLAIYKAVNTADSMIGYRTDRYERFGKAAARADDLLNLIPARLTALILAGTHGGLGHWRDILAEGRRHRSPNAGWPEAALAGALPVRLSGPRVYGNTIADEPWVNAAGPDADAPSLTRGLGLYRRTMALCGLLLVVLALL